jgi:hypothetical protein
VLVGDRGLWAAAACLPVLTHGSSLLVNLEPAAWLTMPPPMRVALMSDALLYTAICLIVAAPLAGVHIASSRPRTTAFHTAGPLIAAVLVFAAVSSLLTLGWMAGHNAAARSVVESHLTLIAVGLALAAWGALCGAVCRDALDAAAVSLLTAMIAAGGLLVAGAVVADLPRSMTAIGLTANPLVVLASAARIDIVRMDVLYQISPLAHVQIDYPAWNVASAWYVAFALLCFAGLTMKLRTRPLVSSPERISS